jgi:hypothetical protein
MILLSVLEICRHGKRVDGCLGDCWGPDPWAPRAHALEGGRRGVCPGVTSSTNPGGWERRSQKGHGQTKRKPLEWIPHPAQDCPHHK